MEMIGAYEVKTHLPQLLDRVARGESLTITRHKIQSAFRFLLPASGLHRRTALLA